MNPAHFPEANIKLKSPPDMEGSCMEIAAWSGQIMNGMWDGTQAFVTCWEPTPEELEDLNNGGKVYLSVMGGMPPHNLSTIFQYKEME